MKLIAISKASVRLDRAREAFNRIQASRAYGEFEAAWTDLLLNLNSIHSILEQGAREPKSNGWFGRRKNERRKDPLLQYLHQARNADEHGLEPVTEFQPGSIVLGSTSGSSYIGRLEMKNGHIEVEDFRDTGGGIPYIQTEPPTARLVTVRDGRFGDAFNPPSEHLGQPIEDKTPLGVAKLGLAYHERMLDEARTYVA